MSKFYYTWADFDKDILEIVKTLKEQKIEPKDIYGIPRGGLIVAVTLSHMLDKPMVFDKSKITKKTLIIDDILDTGKTFKKFYKKGYLPLSVLCFNETKQKTNNVSGVITGRLTGGQWIVFPWETNKTSRYDNTV